MNDEICVGNGFSTFEDRDKILVGLSGGVDSSVCIKILQEQGFDVYAVFIRFSAVHEKDVQKARDIAQSLNVPFEVHSCEEEFEEHVITPFCNEYCNGVTPSPCIICNPLVKFAQLIKVANSMGINYIATGHYARVCESDGYYYIQKAYSEKRDQSYMLYRLNQDVLKRLSLPLGEFEKDEIRQMAQDAKLQSANTPDSQEICFIPDNDYANFITLRGLTDKQGEFIGPKGEKLGKHKGVMHYTVGQRKGLGISYSEPIFVKKIQSDGNILLATAGSEFFSKITANNVIYTNLKPFEKGKTYTVKVRSRASGAQCKVLFANESEFAIEFEKPERAPAPGQSAVLYDADIVIGGGIICDVCE